MKVSEVVIETLKNLRKAINRLAYEFDVHSDTIERWIKENENNGKLTTHTSLEIISQETGIPKSKLLVKA